eukprot:gb/GECH01009241.1/.p1 GENE.gb/GECH01009241.1/~~gb/GECH01009241.1/.p1  ORF type:complete len:217 (+),score=62.34 gb/GECH01009241.1/:1-651(+)
MLPKFRARTRAKSVLITANENTGQQINSTDCSLLSIEDLSEHVQLPSDETENDWIAVHAIDFLDRIKTLRSIFAKECICSKMTAGSAEYLWHSGKFMSRKKTIPAIEYIDNVFEWGENIIQDRKIFPPEGESYPKSFKPNIKTLFKRLFRVFAHIFCHHLEKFRSEGAEPHLNTVFSHFMLFVFEFQLVEKKELECLSITIETLLEDLGRKYLSKS